MLSVQTYTTVHQFHESLVLYINKVLHGLSAPSGNLKHVRSWTNHVTRHEAQVAESFSTWCGLYQGVGGNRTLFSRGPRIGSLDQCRARNQLLHFTKLESGTNNVCMKMKIKPNNNYSGISHESCWRERIDACMNACAIAPCVGLTPHPECPMPHALSSLG